MIRPETFPNKWPIIPLSEAVEFLDSRRKPVKASDRVEGAYPYYGANGQQGTINDYIFDEPLVLLAEDGGHFGIPGRKVAYSISGKTWVNNHAHVLKPKNKICLNFLCRQLEFYDVTRYITGSTRGKLTKADASRIKVCLPPIEEQGRIAAILDKADAIRKKREQAVALADEFLRATFLDMFGDPVTNPKGWEEVPISDFGNLERGKSKHRPRNDPKLLGGPYPLIQTGDVANADFTISSYNQTYSEMGLRQSRMWPKGTLCVTIAANIADTAVLGFDACFPDSVVGFLPKNQKYQSYVQGLFGFLKKIIEERAPQSAQKNINLEILRALTVQRPSIELMEEYNSAVGKTLKLKNRIKSAANVEKYLFASLSQRAFRGEL
ncbi:restriction endonuclease subunit S [Alphaproteobacteria bacterium]|nr:restriction endonuclease subunit S [Alphaproteobacteria bacterium]